MLGYASTGGVNPYASVLVKDDTGPWNGVLTVGFTATVADTAQTMEIAAQSAAVTYLTGLGMPSPDSVVWVVNTDAEAFSFANPTRTLNSAFQVSTARAAQVSYSVDVLCSATLLGGQTGTVFLEYADDSAFTTNVVEVCRAVNGNTVSLAIAVTIGQTVTAQLGGVIPVGKYVRLRTANTTGTPTFTYRSGQEVLV